MKLVPIFSLITVCYSRPNIQDSGNIIYNLLEKGWEAGRQEISAAIDRNVTIEDTVRFKINVSLIVYKHSIILNIYETHCH